MTNGLYDETVFRDWEKDIENGELYNASVHKDNTISISTGRYAQSGGSTTMSFLEFINSDIWVKYIEDHMGSHVLKEMYSAINEVKSDPHYVNQNT